VTGTESTKRGLIYHFHFCIFWLHCTVDPEIKSGGAAWPWEGTNHWCPQSRVQILLLPCPVHVALTHHCLGFFCTPGRMMGGVGLEMMFVKAPAEPLEPRAGAGQWLLFSSPTSFPWGFPLWIRVRMLIPPGFRGCLSVLAKMCLPTGQAAGLGERPLWVRSRTCFGRGGMFAKWFSALHPIQELKA
jgi:hypothetical protein